MKKLVIARRYSQTLFLVLFVYILWSTTYPLQGLLPPKTFFDINPLITVFTSIAERVVLPGIFLSLLMLILTCIFGRFFCGWICPLGAVIDAAGALRKKKFLPSDSTNRKLRKIKFFGLGAIFIFSLIGLQVAWISDPLVIMARFVSLNFIPTLTLLIDKFFIILIKKANLYGYVYDFYRYLKSSFLGIKVYYFANSGLVLAVFLIIALSSIFVTRSWCRVACPLGALYGLVSKISILRRVAEKCTDCGVCKDKCRMGAISSDTSYVKSECILCMDCVYDCPTHETRFSWVYGRRGEKSEKDTPGIEKNKGISRRNFLFLLFSSFFLLGFKGREVKRPLKKLDPRIIRPPGVLNEDRFLNKCIRCGNCMKVCITNGLQPVMLQAGLGGIWTPQLVPEIGYCEYNCTLCGNVCPTGAIPRLSPEKKRKTKLGIAKVDRSICIAWTDNKECTVCQEYCPVPEKAIKFKDAVINGRRILRPYVDEKLCLGCGICQNKCPVRPVRAIRLDPSKRRA